MNFSKLSRISTYLRILLASNNYNIRDFKEWSKSITNPQEFYLDTFRFFYFQLPQQLKRHKYYFNKKSRGFGEKAFHTMWYLLYEKYQFKNFLEIGIYRGQTISLIGLLAKLQKTEISVFGISPFTSVGDQVSQYVEIDYLEDVVTNFEYFHLQSPILLRAYSTEKKALDLISSTMWDCIYIDGSHDYETAKQDWLNCSKQISLGAIIVLDDASLYTNFEAPFFAFRGHSGPSQVAEEIKSDFRFKEVLRVGHNRVFEKIA